MYKLGIDAGSTTVKLSVSDGENVLRSSYARHNADVAGALARELEKLAEIFPQSKFSVCITGSAGMGIAERCGFKFVQELVAEVRAARAMGLKNATIIDIGGEDAKMIFLSENRSPDIRMNGSCAGGTGAFLDQMAALLGVEIGAMGDMALESKKIYPIASRCGVFAKTDVQNLISRRLDLADISASIFRAVALQCAGSLARSTKISKPVLCVGGPLAFLKALRGAFAGVLKIESSSMLVPKFSETFAAAGAAFAAEGAELSIAEILEKLGLSGGAENSKPLPALFEGEPEFKNWLENLSVKKIASREIEEGENLEVFVGADSGSTTSKLVVLDSSGRMVFCRYAPNSGRPLERMREFFAEFSALAKSKNASVKVLGSAATGYGEDLIKAAFNLDFGIVETMAHLQAAKWISPEVSFVLDIGGQDMKSIFVENGAVKNIELNESCSSGCGSFLQGFAAMMNLSLEEFSRRACLAKSPADLGTRCTVFMNSKVKEALRNGAGIADIAAGLSYSVVKNCLLKVLKISNMESLGAHIVVQGGTFKNYAVLRAFEKLSGRKISMCESPELMGAVGAALYAKSRRGAGESAMSWDLDLSKIKRQNLSCGGCSNKCAVVKFSFENGNASHAGNKCEKFFHSNAKARIRGEDGMQLRFDTVFEKPQNCAGGEKIGIPRALNMHENYPFWSELFSGCGFEPVLSAPSDSALAARGALFLMSENLCFPAKLAHGHILDLADKKCARIFFPIAVKEAAEGAEHSNSFNCPVVAGYPSVIRNSMKPWQNFGVKFDCPVINFENNKVLKQGAWDYFKTLGVEKSRFDKAFKNAARRRDAVKIKIAKAQAEILERAKKSGKILLVFTGRPYHADPLINQKAAQIAADLGADVITDDAFLLDPSAELNGVNYISQWTYPNRVMRAAKAVAKLPKNIALVELNSFGCGPDSFLMDEASEILKAAGKNLTVIRIDEISSSGSIRLRLRSLIESLKCACDAQAGGEYRGYNLSYTGADRQKTIVVPFFDEIISPLVPAMGEAAGYKIKVLPPPDAQSVLEGLKYCHNEVCYPATIVAGDIIKFLKAQENPSDYVAAITQTGGQCRATNYLALIKNAMRLAGFGDVKILSVNFGKAFKNSQPAFKLGATKAVKISLMALVYADAVSEMYFACRAREKVRGASKKVAESFAGRAAEFIKRLDFGGLLGLLREAVRAFNAVELCAGEVKKVGFIGEIYLKYNSFSHCGISDWLAEKRIEVVRPPLRNFVMQYFVNSVVNEKNRVERRGFLRRLLSPLALKYMRSKIEMAERIKSEFKFARENSPIFDMAQEAEKILPLACQFGEGWLIAAEIAEFAKAGVDRVVCVQPFGCIANHVVAKGIERRVRDLFPNMSMLFLDIDSSTALVNLQNRLHFLIE